MATGDILSTTILATGWEAEIVIEGRSVGGTFAFDTNGGQLADMATAKVKFTVVSEGYSTAGTLGTKTRYVYGTCARMKAYPNQASIEEAAIDTTNLKVTIALSEYIYDDDNTGGGKSGTAPTVTFLTGFCSGGNNATADAAVTNNSTADYPKAIARWAVVPYQRVVTTFDLECLAFHRFAEHGKPVACVIFSHTDATTDAVATATMSKSAAADALPCYARTITASNYTDNTLYNWQFTVYPWVGDADSVLTTVGGTANALTIGPLPLYMDSDDDIPVYFACVNTSTGSDSTGVASTTYATASASPCLTIRYALARIQAANTNADFGVIYLQGPGTHTWGAGTGTGTNTNSWVTVTRDPNVTKANAVITAGTAGYVVSTTLLKLYDLTVVPTGYLFTGAAGRTIWLDQVAIAAAAQLANATFDTYANAYFTYSTCDQVDYAFAQYSTGNSSLIRSCSATKARGFNSQSAYGQSVVVTSTITTRSANGGGAGVQAPRPRVNAIVAYNKFWRVNRETTALPDPAADNTALVGNLIEVTTGTTGWAAATLGLGTSTPWTNHLSWHNTIAGYSYGVGYTNAANRVISQVALKYDCARIIDNKVDVFDANGTNINTWSCTYGVGWIGNNSEWTADLYWPLYFGIGSTRATLCGFVTDNSYSAGGVTTPGNGSGGGDYRPTAASVLLNNVPSGMAVLPFDLDGVARRNDGTGAAGAYEYVPTPFTLYRRRVAWFTHLRR